MASLTMQQIRATTLGKTPTIEELLAWIDHTIKLQSDVGALQGGGIPEWQSAIDTRWTYSETSGLANSYTITMDDAAGNALYEGLMIRIIDIAATNTGSATLNAGTTDGAVTIVKRAGDGSRINLSAGDLRNPSLFIYDGGQWVLQNPSSAFVMHHVDTIAPTSGDGNNGDFWYVKV